MEIPTLITERLILRPFRPADAPSMAEMLAEPDVLRYFPPSGDITLERAQRMITGIIRHWQEQEYGLWAITRRADQTLLGRCGLQYLAEVDGVEVDFLLGKPFWNQGYATEAALASIQHGFDQLSLNQITGIVHVDNLASQRVLEKLGMTRQEQARFFGIECYRYELKDPKSPFYAR